ncbi:hypothetical protein CCMSSC00406_0002932 [Pleurotus cornucopiae]|uniref:Uncharacterized protein n=1 Tax=Pleurotus cornucopiae TaxID=5321 RepID=A0ACB7J6J7_PLECO|nr:hypothetical protein CCMSSC00406_0002932 [Pleurotus cornucopiae]
MKDGGARLYYLDLSNPLQAAKTAIYVTLTRPATARQIFRCFIVWGRMDCAFPLMLLIGTGVAGFGATSTNVVCTSLILYGILRIHSAVKDFAIMIVESAAVYSASVISLMTMYSVGSNAQYTVLDMTGPLIGITFRYIAALLN